MFSFYRILREQAEVRPIMEEDWTQAPAKSVLTKMGRSKKAIIKCTKEQNENSFHIISEAQTDLERALLADTLDYKPITSLSIILEKATKKRKSF